MQFWGPAPVLDRLDFYNSYSSELPSLKKGVGDEAKALCPFHEDTSPSLSVNLRTGKYYCFGCNAGGDVFSYYQARHHCDFKTALVELAKIAGVVYLAKRMQGQKGKLIKAYNYTDEIGKVLFQVCRYDPKKFRQRRPDGNGGWIWNLKGVRIIPYRLTKILTAQRVFITEGEEDVQALEQVGLIASTNPMGAGKWRAQFNPFFKTSM
ncbi:MAG: CHC2 zinc finger domain-containing protein [Desulfobacteraceae bacterium]